MTASTEEAVLRSELRWVAVVTGVIGDHAGRALCRPRPPHQSAEQYRDNRPEDPAPLGRVHRRQPRFRRSNGNCTAMLWKRWASGLILHLSRGAAPAEPR